MKTSKVTTTVRKSIVAAVAAFATASNLPFNTVSGAVLFAAEKLENPTIENVTALINNDTVAAYQTEVARRASAKAAQIAGMVKNALPKELRTPENIAKIVAELPAGQSIKSLVVNIAAEVEALDETPILIISEIVTPAYVA